MRHFFTFLVCLVFRGRCHAAKAEVTSFSDVTSGHLSNQFDWTGVRPSTPDHVRRHYMWRHESRVAKSHFLKENATLHDFSCFPWKISTTDPDWNRIYRFGSGNWSDTLYCIKTSTVTASVEAENYNKAVTSEDIKRSVFWTALKNMQDRNTANQQFILRHFTEASTCIIQQTKVTVISADCNLTL